ncbi:Oligopeptide transport ATP-binding protein OppF [Desulfosarcina cetonica]|uniref:ABC transporter ATP-binding protein n=1 Tax=Desulfosarcina cetonica TaxID=90730 RepID=UPI0006D017AC|nr:dipeptide/oligopeptide/nickel ABC transporter ATP-binding protein [Desulfosarcina cetonica]VTR67033.1 Oligopeptide transport ATP-binding protein OppF [Desulfosarcina cetonica]
MHVEARGISKIYGSGWLIRRRRLVLDGIDMALAPGKRIGIVGRSGAGKTTLGLILAGILRPDTGQLRCGGIDLWTAGRQVRRRLGQRLQMVFQHPESSFDPRWTLARSLEEPFRLCGRVPSMQDLSAMLASVELQPALLTRRPGELSGGELQRMAISRALAMVPAVLVLDEPTAMLDVLTQARIIRLLEKIQRDTGVTIVLISHDPALINSFCHRVYRLDAGRIDFQGNGGS